MRTTCEERAFFQLTLLILLFRAKSRNTIFKGIINNNINQIGQPLALQVATIKPTLLRLKDNEKTSLS